jgi:predicted RNA methylase
MPSPLTVSRNDYRRNPKPSTIYTPPGVASFLFDILYNSMSYNVLRHPQFKTVLDPAIGTGRLTDPWKKAGCRVLGCDIDPHVDESQCDFCHTGRFEDITDKTMLAEADVVVCNPPFNGAAGKRLYPEVFLSHVFTLFRPTMPVAMFTPMGFRLNQRIRSTRWRWLRDCGARITSVVSLPLDVFPGVEFHCEVVIFNVHGVQPHYFLPEEALR